MQLMQSLDLKKVIQKIDLKINFSHLNDKYFSLIAFSTYFIIFTSIACLFNIPVSISIASPCLSKGLFFLLMSWLFLILRAFLTSLSFISNLFFFNSLYLLRDAVFKLHLKKNFISELGRILVDISLPSIQQFLFFFEKVVWKLNWGSNLCC